MVKDLAPEQKRELDEALNAREEGRDPETGLRPPSWWRGDEDAAALAAAFMGTGPPGWGRG